MASNLFNKNWDRAISPIVGAPRPDQIVQGFSPSLRVREMETSAAFAAIERANRRGAERSFKWTPTPDDRPREIHVHTMKVDYKLAESMSPELEIDLKGQEHVRAMLAKYYRDLEASLLFVICEKLRVDGRIAPGEPLLKEPDPNGRGFTLYRFPG